MLGDLLGLISDVEELANTSGQRNLWAGFTTFIDYLITLIVIVQYFKMGNLLQLFLFNFLLF